jgi:hypothetical protein
MQDSWKIILVVTAVLAVIFYTADYNSRRQAEKLTRVTNVWMPHPITGQRFPYYDVEVLEKGNDFVRFRTKDGQVLEQHGTFSIETKKR